MRYLAFFDTAEVPAAPSWATDVTRDAVQSRAGAMMVTAEGGLAPADFPPPPYRYVVGFFGPETDLEALRSELGALAVARTNSQVKVDGPIPDGYVKNVGFIHRKTDLTRDEFGAYWTGPHAALALASGPRFVRYVLNVVDEVAGDFGWDGVVEQWFTGADELAKHNAIDAPGRTVMAEDLPKMLSAVDLLLVGPAS